MIAVIFNYRNVLNLPRLSAITHSDCSGLASPAYFATYRRGNTFELRKRCPLIYISVNAFEAITNAQGFIQTQ